MRTSLQREGRVSTEMETLRPKKNRDFKYESEELCISRESEQLRVSLQIRVWATPRLTRV